MSATLSIHEMGEAIGASKTFVDQIFGEHVDAIRRAWFPNDSKLPLPKAAEYVNVYLPDNGMLPRRCYGRNKMERLGVRFGKRVVGNPLYVHAKLPEGWKRRALSEDAPVIEIVDSQDNVMATIFICPEDKKAPVFLEANV